MKSKIEQKETRFFQIQDLQVESRSDGLGPKIVGYAAVFNKLSDDLGGFREKIKPGAFRKALKNSDARGLLNHNPDYVLGRQSNGTLMLKEDAKGLKMEIDPPDTQIIRDLVIAPLKRGDIREQSFGFIVEKDEWDNLEGEKKDKPIVRTIIETKELFDVSIVTFPAYPDTSVALRSMEKAKETVFKPASENDILQHRLMQYLNAEQPEQSQDAIIEIIKILLPKLNDEQRQILIPTSNSDAKSPDDDVDTYSGNMDKKKSSLTDTVDPWKRIDARYNKLNLKLRNLTV